MTASQGARPAPVPPSPAPQPGSLPLAGLKIVELSSYVASPLAGLTLAQLGADVIRVEPSGGAADRTRLPVHPSGTSLYWAGLNRNKRAIEVDLTSTEGRGLVSDLIVHAGTLISNTERHRDLSYPELSARRPDLVHVQLTGRHNGDTAVDYTVQAATGFPMVTGAHPADPVNHVLPAWDVAAGLYLATALLAADRHRLLSGAGQYLRVALEDVALATAGSLGFLTEAQLTEIPRQRCGNYVHGTFGRDFVTADGHRLMLVVLTRRHWRDLLSITGVTEAVAALEKELNADFAQESERFRHRVPLAEMFAAWFRERTVDEAEAALGSTRILWSRYRTFGDWAQDDARLLRDNPLLVELHQPGVGTYLAPGSPIVTAARNPPRPAPGIGEHTEEVLRDELGLSAQELRKLRDARVLGGPPRAETPR